jgi:HSF-type DNA-binding
MESKVAYKEGEFNGNEFNATGNRMTDVIPSSSKKSALMISRAGRSNIYSAPLSTLGKNIVSPVAASSLTRELCDLGVSMTNTTLPETLKTDVMSNLTQMTPHEVGMRQLPLNLKLYYVLSSSSFDEIVTWMHHGRAWKILQIEGFVAKVLPLFLSYDESKANKFNTFVRLLKLWGFQQFTKGPDKSAFFNLLFTRERPYELLSMRPSAVNGDRPLHEPEAEPNFYIAQENTHEQKLRDLRRHELSSVSRNIRSYVPTECQPQGTQPSLTFSKNYAAVDTTQQPRNISTKDLLSSYKEIFNSRYFSSGLKNTQANREDSHRIDKNRHTDAVYLKEGHTAQDCSMNFHYGANPSPVCTVPIAVEFYSQTSTFVNGRKTAQKQQKWSPPIGPAM